MDAMSPRLEQNHKDDLVFPTDLMTFILFVGLFCLAIFAFNERLLQDPDTYWHIETGRWIWNEQSFPRTDIFSHTIWGQPWINMEWLSQIIFYFSYAWLGWHGVVMVTALAIAATFTLLYRLLARELRATVALGICAVSFFFASMHFLARPHLLTFPIIVLWVSALVRAREENRSPSFWLIPLITLWANLHGAFTFGIVLAGALGFEALLTAPAAKRPRVLTEWLIFGVCAIAAACLTPYGYHGVLETYNVLTLGPVLQNIGEWRPMDAHNDHIHELVLLVLVTLALTYGARIKFPRALITVGILHFGLKHVRGLSMVALTWPFLLAGPLRSQFPFLRPSHNLWPFFGAGRSGWLPAVGGVGAAAMVIVALGAFYVRAHPAVKPSADITPQVAVDYASRERISGPVFNDSDFGGYLVFRGIKTFIDGRMLPFGRQFAGAYFEAQNIKNLQKLGEMTDSYKVSWTLLRPNTTAAYYFDHSPKWRRAYADDIAIIHVRR